MLSSVPISLNFTGFGSVEVACKRCNPSSTLSDVPALAGNIPVSPTGSSKAETLKKEIKLVIEKIILNDTGDKDKKQLVKELLEELIEELKGADEVISSADLGVLL